MNQENYADQPPHFKNQPEYLIFPRYVRSLLEYAYQVFHSSLPGYLSNQIERRKTRAFPMLLPKASHKEALEMTAMPTLYERTETLCKE